MEILAYLFSAFILSLGQAQQDHAISRLLRDLFEDYNRDAIPMKSPPVNDTANALDLAVGVSVIDLDIPSKGILSVSTWLRMFWTDFRLSWTPQHYEGIKSVRVSPRKIWTPDLSIYNAVMRSGPSFEERLTASNSLAIVYATGNILWITPILIEVASRQEPDENIVESEIRIGSWTYDGYHINLTAFGGSEILDTSDLSTNSKYRISDQKQKSRAVNYYPCCSEPYISMDYKFHVRRSEEESSSEESSEEKYEE